MAITVAMRTEVSQLYVALFGRAPDADGLGYWTQRVDSGDSMTTIANAMYGTDPARAYFPLFLTNQEIIASFYLNVLGRPADAEGLAYWTAQLNATGATPGSVISTMINVVANYVALGGTDPAGLTSASLFNNKVAVAQYYGEHSGNIADATVVLAGVTADASTVTAVEAQIDTGAIGQSGITAALTTGADLVNGTTAGDTVTGVFGNVANATYNAGDVIDLGAGSTDTLNLVANGTTVSDSVIVKNVEVINITDTKGATFDDTLVQNNPGINFLSTQAGTIVGGQTSTVINAALGSVYGLSGTGNLTVAYTGTSGTADTALVSLAGVGTSTAKSTVNVSSTNSIEKVSIAATGANYVTLVGGTNAASLAVTGDGTNTIDLSSTGAMAAVGTIDASASTGANTFALGTNFNTGTTIKGGTGADTVSATLAGATLSAPTFTGIETFSTKWTAYGVLDLGSTTGLTAVSVNDAGAGGTVTVQNAQSTLSTLTVSAVTTANDALKFGYASSSKGDLAFHIGSTSSSATAVDLGAVTISNSTGLAVSTLGALAHQMDTLTVKGDQTALSFTVAAGGSLGITDGLVPTHGVVATGALGELDFNLGAGSTYSGYVAVTTPGKDIGNINVTATGNNDVFKSYIWTSGGSHGGSIGNITVTANGNNFSGHLGATASGGSVGDVTFNFTGNGAEFTTWISAGYVSAGASTVIGTVGNIAVNVTGDDNNFSGDIGADVGNIGNVSVNIAGDSNSVSVSAYAHHGYYSDGTNYQNEGGGNVGDVSVNINGDSFGYVTVQASGGHMGDIAISLDNGGFLDFYAEASTASWYSGAPDGGGNIGNITITEGDDAGLYSYISANGGNIGNVTVNVNGSNASGYLHLRAEGGSGAGNSYGYVAGGDVGNITVNIAGAGAHFGMEVIASGGNIGDVNVSLTGSNASGYVELYSQGRLSGGPAGDIGAVNVTLGHGNDYAVYANLDGTMGPLTVVGGDNNFFFFSAGGGYSPASFDDDVASITSISVTMGDSDAVQLHVSGFSGAVGSITASMGAGGTFSAGFFTVDSVSSINVTQGASSSTQLHYYDVGTAGAVNFTGGAGSTFYLGVSGGMTSLGKVTLTGGDSASSAGVYVTSTTGTGTMGGVDASSWAGELGVDLHGVGAASLATAVGTTIRVGTGGSVVLGTEGADNIFEGSGKDTVVFDTTVDTNTHTDVVFNFTAGAGKDVMDIEATTTTLLTTYTADTAHTAAAGDIIRLAGITGGHDITSVANLVTAVNAGGDFASVDSAAGHYTIVTAASATAGTVYVFDVEGTAATLSASEVTLVGVVNLATGNITTLAATNFG
jgi:hypothetical protein